MDNHASLKTSHTKEATTDDERPTPSLLGKSLEVLPLVNRTSLRNRFGLYMGSMFLLLSILGGVSYMSLQSTISEFDQVANAQLLQLRRLVYLQDLVGLTSVPIHQYIAIGDVEEKALLFEEITSEASSMFDEVIALIRSNQNQYNLVLKAKSEWQKAVAIGHRILAIPDPQQGLNLKHLLPKFVNNIEGAVDIMYEAHNINLKQIEVHRNTAQQRFEQTRLITMTGFITGILTFIAGIVAMVRFVLRPANHLLESLNRFGHGDLSHRIPVYSYDEFGALSMGFNRMAENLEKDQQQLAELAIRDSLTGLYNRREFERLLADEVNRYRRHGHPVSLLVMDLDKFKLINDRYGHLAGDAALKAVAEIITNQSRTGDVIARFGGEEITVLLPETPADNAHVLAERTCKAIADFPIMISPTQALPITVSIGVATIPVNAQSSRDLITASDMAMYEAKRSGRNCVRSASPSSQTLPLGDSPKQ